MKPNEPKWHPFKVVAVLVTSIVHLFKFSLPLVLLEDNDYQSTKINVLDLDFHDYVEDYT
jgi:hypothetical protein